MKHLELQTEKIPIWNHNEDVYLKAYSLKICNKKDNQDRRPAVIICPGGGYLCISKSESDPVAYRFAEAGFQPFVLNYSIMEQARYREGEPFKPVLELGKVLNIVYEKADCYCIDQNKLVLVGFSAGGHLAASYCSAADKTYRRPAALILSYPLIDYRYLNNSWSLGAGIDQINLYHLAAKKVFGSVIPSEKQLEFFDVKNRITDKMPPTFIWHSMDDNVIDVDSSIRLAQNLRAKGNQCKLNLFEKGIHGEPFYENEWFDLAIKWLKGIIYE